MFNPRGVLALGLFLVVFVGSAEARRHGYDRWSRTRPERVSTAALAANCGAGLMEQIVSGAVAVAAVSVMAFVGLCIMFAALADDCAVVARTSYWPLYYDRLSWPLWDYRPSPSCRLWVGF